MSIEPIQPSGTPAIIAELLDHARAASAEFSESARSVPAATLGQAAADLETLANLIGVMQLAAADAIDHQDLAHTAESPTSFTWDVSDGRTSQFRNTAEFMRARLGVGLSEARRRLRLAAALRPGTTLSGQTLPPRCEYMAEGVAEGSISTADANLIERALTHVQPLADAEVMQYMEQSLTEQAESSDTDTLRQVIKHHINHIDQDGDEPTEAELAERQGVFNRGRHHGLTRFAINATDAQAEALLTVMNTATNPRQRPCPGFLSSASRPDTAVPISDAERDPLDRRTRQQKMLDGLVGGCQLALATDRLPATGGLRPQIMATIEYSELLARIDTARTRSADGGGTGSTNGLAVRPADDGPSPTAPATGGTDTNTGHEGPGSGLFSFTGPVAARIIRRMACDADIIPIVFGGDNEILDMGRAQRLYGPKARKAITARDHGCIFPNCTMPAPWTEVHHIIPWSEGGRTDIGTGVLACSFHHHLYHQGDWRIVMVGGTPWSVPPPYIDPPPRPLRTTYWDDPHRSPPAPAAGSQPAEAPAPDPPQAPMSPQVPATPQAPGPPQAPASTQRPDQPCDPPWPAGPGSPVDSASPEAPPASAQPADSEAPPWPADSPPPGLPPARTRRSDPDLPPWTDPPPG